MWTLRCQYLWINLEENEIILSPGKHCYTSLEKLDFVITSTNTTTNCDCLTRLRQNLLSLFSLRCVHSMKAELHAVIKRAIDTYIPVLNMVATSLDLGSVSPCGKACLSDLHRRVLLQDTQFDHLNVLLHVENLLQNLHRTNTHTKPLLVCTKYSRLLITVSSNQYFLKQTANSCTCT